MKDQNCNCGSRERAFEIFEEVSPQKEMSLNGRRRKRPWAKKRRNRRKERTDLDLK